MIGQTGKFFSVLFDMTGIPEKEQIITGLTKNLPLIVLPDKLSVKWEERGKHPIHWAAGFGKLDALRSWIQNGTPLNMSSIWLYTPLMYACRNGHLDIIRELIKCGVDVNYETKGKIPPRKTDLTQDYDRHNIPLLLACQYASSDTVELLLDHGANVNAQGRDGNTALHIAVQERCITKVKLLLDHGALLLKNGLGETPKDLDSDNINTWPPDIA